jgi:hypothetical protein
VHGRVRRGALAVAAVALVAIAGAVTYAVADVGGGGLINGCYKAQNGQLRVIDPATGHCLPHRAEHGIPEIVRSLVAL